jgi:UDP-N-acetylmuramyl pentapeptide phosphotransferase/UDP-N-acetylglucosamine-1-phosphate transferase
MIGPAEWIVPMLLAAWGAVLIVTLPPALIKAGLTKANFRGDIIPTACGIGILLWCLPALTYWHFLAPSKLAPSAMLMVTLGYGVLGFIDDRWGSRRYSGIKGHVRALLRDRTLTTGLVKALGGVAVGLIAGFMIAGGNPSTAFASGLVIALSANAMNLLDLRPGRAGAVFLLASIAAFAGVAALRNGIVILMIPAAIVYLFDARGRVMLGDTGSNLMGGALGLVLALTATAEWLLWLEVVLLVALHVFAERRSISEVIERNPLLRRVDAWTGVR